MPTDYIEGESGQQAVFGYESSPGTEATTIDKRLGVVQSVDPIDIGYEQKDGYSIASQQRLYSRAVRGNYAFSVDFFITDFRFLHQFFGAYAVSGTDPYTHVNTHSNELPSLSYEIMNDDLGVSRKVIGCKAVNGSISWSEGEELKAKIEYLGRSSEKDITPQSSSEGTKVPFFADEMTIASLNSVERVTDVMSGTWNINRNSEVRRSVGSKEPRFIKEGKVLHNIELELYQQNMLLYDLAMDETEFQTQLKFVKDAGNDEASFTFPQSKVFKPNQAIPGDDVLKESPTIEVFRDYGSELVTASIIDAFPSYVT